MVIAAQRAGSHAKMPGALTFLLEIPVILLCCLIVALIVLNYMLDRKDRLRQQRTDLAYQCLDLQRSAYRAQTRAAVDRFACAIVTLDTQVAELDALLTTITVEYAQTAASRDTWRFQFAGVCDMYDHAITVKEAWKSHALGHEVLMECLADNDATGATNAVKAIANSRQILRDLGEYDA